MFCRPSPGELVSNAWSSSVMCLALSPPAQLTCFPTPRLPYPPSHGKPYSHGRLCSPPAIAKLNDCVVVGVVARAVRVWPRAGG